MKTCTTLALLLTTITLFANTGVTVRDSTGFPGDHFSLEGAVMLLKESESPEDFEKRLNTESSKVNNLDLNEDGEIDYIRVIDNMEGDVHALVLQVPVSEEESQDVAVIEIEKTGDEEAILQIIGDPDVYGEQVIVEPFAEEVTPDKQKRGGGPMASPATSRIVVNVYFWPGVRFLYRPGYTVWVSPWGWRTYPRWWSPWRPRPWRVHFGHTHVYRVNCHVTTTHRVVRAHRIYTPRRRTSTTVVQRTTVVRSRKSGTTTVRKKSATVKRSAPSGTAVGRKNTKTRVAKKGDGTVGSKKTTTAGTRKRGNTASGAKKTTKTRAAKKGNRAAGVRKTKTVRKKRKN